MNLRSVIKGKRGGMTDLVLFSIVSFAFVVCIGIIWYVMEQTETQLYAQAPAIQKATTSLNVTTLMQQTIGTATNSYDSLGWITTMIIIAMALSIIISSALIKTNPFWFVAYIFVVVISVIIGVYVANSYEEIYTNPGISAGFTGLMASSWIMLHIHIWVMVIGFIAGIFLFINIDWGQGL
jgi:hypothetical protein